MFVKFTVGVHRFRVTSDWREACHAKRDIMFMLVRFSQGNSIDFQLPFLSPLSSLKRVQRKALVKGTDSMDNILTSINGSR